MGTPTLWVGFNAAVLAMLALDLGIFHRHSHAVSLRGAAAWSAVWVSLSLGFNLWILRTQGAGPALEFFTGYLIEKSLSLDNLFVFLLVFRSFGVALQYQHRVLFWGVMGALVMRGALVGIGAALVARFAWILLVLGALLVIVGVRMLVRGRPDLHPERNPILRWLREIFPIAHGETGERFFVLENGRRAMTALFLALVVLEGADVIFALDSVPAVFGITRDPFLVYTSNVCAILGLRAFYFLLAGALPFFRYLNAGISAVLIFVGGKMLVEPWIRVSTQVSLTVVGALLGAAVAASFLAARASESTPG
jgi:tellurite resistance protein TerC